MGFGGVCCCLLFGDGDGDGKREGGREGGNSSTNSICYLLINIYPSSSSPISSPSFLPSSSLSIYPSFIPSHPIYKDSPPGSCPNREKKPIHPSIHPAQPLTNPQETPITALVSGMEEPSERGPQRTYVGGNGFRFMNPILSHMHCTLQQELFHPSIQTSCERGLLGGCFSLRNMM